VAVSLAWLAWVFAGFTEKKKGVCFSLVSVHLLLLHTHILFSRTVLKPSQLAAREAGNSCTARHYCIASVPRPCPPSLFLSRPTIASNPATTTAESRLQKAPLSRSLSQTNKSIHPARTDRETPRVSRWLHHR
jgi:hypothetical protein